jgi:hypothetical protein
MAAENVDAERKAYGDEGDIEESEGSEEDEVEKGGSFP